MHSPQTSKSGQILFVTFCLFSAIYIAWLILARYDFFYSKAYDLLDIGATIQRYGPDNHVRPHFEHTSRSERERLFAEIAKSVRNRGTGLENITYTTNDQNHFLLLTPAEISHLRSVSILAMQAEFFGKLALTVLGLMVIYLRVNQRHPPRTTPALLYTLGIATLLVIVITLAGPKAVFYQWHEWAFPEEQQWFFFYEESLMTMLMKAPDLFGFIAIVWSLLTVMIYAALLAAARILTIYGNRLAPNRQE